MRTRRLVMLRRGLSRMVAILLMLGATRIGDIDEWCP
jgi:hypothetical protein